MHKPVTTPCWVVSRSDALPNRAISRSAARVPPVLCTTGAGAAAGGGGGTNTGPGPCGGPGGGGTAGGWGCCGSSPTGFSVAYFALLRDAVSCFQWPSVLLSVSLHDVPESGNAGWVTPSPFRVRLTWSGPRAECFFFEGLPRNASRSLFALASRALSLHS